MAKGMLLHFVWYAKLAAVYFMELFIYTFKFFYTIEWYIFITLRRNNFLFAMQN